MEKLTHTIEENGLFARATLYDGVWRVVARRPHQTTWTVLGTAGTSEMAAATIMTSIRVLCKDKGHTVRRP